MCSLHISSAAQYSSVDGTALTQKQISSLKKLTAHIILALDADMAGEEAIKRLAVSIDAETMMASELKVVAPISVKDPDE
jgi:DNA primase